MPDSRQLRVVFRAAAGPRIGYGHLVRATAMGQVLGVPAQLSLRGQPRARRVARSLGWTLVSGSADSTLAASTPSLLVIDDPAASQARSWCRAAARQGIPVASITDLGLVPCGADLTIDGSIVHPAGSFTGPTLRGPRYLILSKTSAVWRDRCEPVVLIALGGGPHSRVALALARRIRAARPGVRVRIAGGLTAATPAGLEDGVSWVGPRHGLAADMAAATVAVVGGGLSLYEACCVGTPAIGVAVVPAQRPTIAGLAKRGAALDGGHLGNLPGVVRLATGLLDDGFRRAQMSRSGRRLIDGHGADRVAEHLHRLMRNGRAQKRKEASR